MAGMVSEESAKAEAERLSLEHKNKAYCVYRTPTKNHWVRQDDWPREQSSGIHIRFVCAFLNGKPVQPKILWIEDYAPST